LKNKYHKERIKEEVVLGEREWNNLFLKHPEKKKECKDYVAVSQWFLEEFDKNLKLGGI